MILSVFLEESKQVLSEHKDNISHLRESIWFLIKHRSILMFMIIVWLLSGLSNIYFFTQQVYFRELWFSIEFIWITFTLWALFSALWSYIFKKISNQLTDTSILNLMLFTALAWSILFALFWQIYAILWLMLISIISGFVMTFWNNFLIQKVPKNQKSTILSIFSLSITIGYSWFNIILSWVIWFLWLPIVYTLTVCLIWALIILNMFTFNRIQKSL
jgi:hypothetical protein